MKVYIYCLTEGTDALPNSLRGIAGAAVRWIDTGCFSSVVSDFAGEAVLVNRENALAHAAVVQSVFKQTTPLPFRFGTLVTEPKLNSYLTARRETLQRKLEQVRGCVEMSVKIVWNRNWTDESLHKDVQEKPGTAFLHEKRRQLMGSEARAAEARRIAVWLEDKTGEMVREKRIDTNPTEKLLLAAAYLVERGAVEQYRVRLKEAREEKPELHFLVSGPWPPYSFANIDLEFKSQFGVS
ncbi:MAG TPA: GvpL/GvpF family gas vesicle protein [Pyrinomonadaceae bacterium]|jgi:metal-sulfur cluster biosynthetic enzyme